ncbi:MAG: YpdA family putative bacillithiol disulfide reductase [Bacteroidota bacterium]|nr:YpdA family putative bacillithiol disulfide reductase [Bacteroidota bacterium]
MLDVVVVGAGPVGLACGIEATRAGLHTVVVDKGALANSLVGYPLHMEFFSTAELLEIGGHPFPSLRIKPTRTEALQYYRRVAKREDLNLRLYERVLRVEGDDGSFTVVTEKEALSCRKVIVVTGFFDVPNKLGVPGEELPKVTHYYREPYAYAGQQVAVIGAKNSAAIAALECHHYGAKVTLIHRGAELSNRIKYWILPDLTNRIKEGSITALLNAKVQEITARTLSVATPDGTQTLPNDYVLAMTGYRPDYSFLKSLSIAINRDASRTPQHDPETFETNRKGVYLAGTVCGGLHTSRWFIENGRFHAKQILQHIRTGAVEPQHLEQRHWKTAE